MSLSHLFSLVSYPALFRCVRELSTSLCDIEAALSHILWLLFTRCLCAVREVDTPLYNSNGRCALTNPTVVGDTSHIIQVMTWLYTAFFNSTYAEDDSLSFARSTGRRALTNPTVVGDTSHVCQVMKSHNIAFFNSTVAEDDSLSFAKSFDKCSLINSTK